MGKPLFKLCSPCCNNCPVIERNGDTVIIYDPESPSSGRIEMPLRVLETLLDPVQGAAMFFAGAVNQTLFLSRCMEARLCTDEVSLNVHQPVNHSFRFKRVEWNQLFGSDENRRLALESLRTNEPVVLNPVPVAKAA